MTTKHQHAGIVEAYAGDEDRPLPGYLASVATYRLSRILTKASITSALRAPLVRYKGKGAPGEVAEEVAPEAKEHTTTHALAELVTCPYCLGQWIATFLVTGQVLAPRFAITAWATAPTARPSDRVAPSSVADRHA